MSESTTIKPPEVPENWTTFARQVADIAIANGIDRFEMSFEPNFNQKYSVNSDHRLRGDLKIEFSNRDGRGRPCQNLAIHLEAYLTHHIVQNPESWS